MTAAKKTGWNLWCINERCFCHSEDYLLDLDAIRCQYIMIFTEILEGEVGKGAYWKRSVGSSDKNNVIYRSQQMRQFERPCLQEKVDKRSGYWREPSKYSLRG